MSVSVLRVTCWGEEYAVRADWAQAADEVLFLGEDGIWMSTGRQVADFRHRAEDALRENMTDIVEMGGNSLDPDDDRYDEDVAQAVEDALNAATYDTYRLILMIDGDETERTYDEEPSADIIEVAAREAVSQAGLDEDEIGVAWTLYYGPDEESSGEIVVTREMI